MPSPSTSHRLSPTTIRLRVRRSRLVPGDEATRLGIQQHGEHDELEFIVDCSPYTPVPSRSAPADAVAAIFRDVNDMTDEGGREFTDDKP